MPFLDQLSHLDNDATPAIQTPERFRTPSPARSLSSGIIQTPEHYRMPSQAISSLSFDESVSVDALFNCDLLPSGGLNQTTWSGMPKFYLTIQQQSVFVGTRCAIDDQTLAYHKKVPDCHVKFLITTVFARRANNWTGYDPDKHSPGS